jgi:hypothetical protein
MLVGSVTAHLPAVDHVELGVRSVQGGLVHCISQRAG